MDDNQELISWFRRMGYDGEIPDSLKNICNSSTSFVWNQLIQNTKPKQEADNLRHNIIINRLRRKSLDKQDGFSYPLKEIDLYIRKHNLENKLSNIKGILSEKKNKLHNVSQSNKMKYVAVEKLKAKIKENEQREYLLRKRCKVLEQNIQETEETLKCAKNLTPVEMDENPNTNEITETLQKCSEKLERLLHNAPPPSQPNSSRKTVKPFSSAQKHSKNPSNFEKLLVMSERKYSTKLTILKHGPSGRLINEENKENVIAKKINVNLFCDDDQNVKNKKRESLGILHESYLNENNFNFLNGGLLNDDDVFMSPLISIQENFSTKTSTKYEPDAEFIRYDNLHLSTFSQLNPSYSKQAGLKLEFLYNDEFVMDKLRTLLYNHNRYIIWNTIQNLTENLNLEITKNITFASEQSNRNQQVNQKDIARLQFLHIQTELQTLKLKIITKELSTKIDKRKKQLSAAIAHKCESPEKSDSIERLLEEQLLNVGLDSVLAEMKKEINLAKKFVDNSDLQIALGKIAQMKDDIINKIGNIKQYVNCIHEILSTTVSTSEQTVACVRKLGPFVEDLSWSTLLTENTCSTETKTFELFPLEYNRRCVYTDPRIYYRDIAQNIPMDVDLDSDSVYMLTTILESPFSPPETVLLNILKSKMKLDALKAIKPLEPNIIRKHYSLKELQAQESYVQYALDKLNAILYSANSSKTLATADIMKKVMEIWVEMPLKDFISTKRTVEGKDYKFYEKQYDSFYENF